MIDFSFYKDKFINKLGDTSNYPPNSLFFSEALAIYSFTQYYNIDMLIESGVFRGGSTSIWVKILDNIEIRCFDILESPRHKDIVQNVIDKYKANSKIKFMIGDSIIEVPKLIEENSDLKIGVFIDGPKDQKGLDLAEKCLSYDNVLFSSLHDWTKSKKYFNTHLEDYKHLVNGMDNTHPQIKKYPNGPGLTILTKEDL